MSDVLNMLTNLDTVIKNIDKNIQDHKVIVTQITDTENAIQTKQNTIKSKEEIKTIFISASKAMRDKARLDFEKIVTGALQFVTQDSTCRFVIEEIQSRGKPGYEFYIETIVNNKICRRKPEDSSGGGFIDIISITGKVAYWKIFNNPRVMNYCFPMDEPSKMVSEQMSVKFAEYIKFLGKQFGLQVIMITHDDTISAVADTTFTVTKNRNGVSEVQLLSDLSGDWITEDIQELLEENENVEE